MAETPVRPAWLADGAEVYEVSGRTMSDGYAVRKVVVARASKTRVIVLVGRAEIAYRLSDLNRVGQDVYQSPELAPPTDRRVADAGRREKTMAAMRPLTSLITEYLHGARIHTRDANEARQIAESIRDAAQSALDNLPEGK